MKKSTSFIIIIIMLAAIFAILFKHFPNSISTSQSKISLIFSVVVIISMASRISASNMKLGLLLKQITGWMVITLLIITGYSYQYEIKQFGNRLSATIIPGYAQGNGDGSVTFYAGENGHFAVTALLNDVERVQFLFDTGASMVSLTASDASNMGININQLNYNFPLSTANGISYGARINIARIQVGPIIIENVEAVICKDGTSDISLLGMSFLGKLKQFSIKGNSLTLIN